MTDILLDGPGALIILAAAAAAGCLAAEIIWRGIASLWKDIRR